MKNIDYDYFINLSNKDLDKIVSHIKNIQFQRKTELSNAFKDNNLDKIINLLPEFKKDVLEIEFNQFCNDFNLSINSLNLFKYLNENNYISPINLLNINRTILWKNLNLQSLNLIESNYLDYYNLLTSEIKKESNLNFQNIETIQFLYDKKLLNDSLFENPKSYTIISFMLNNNMVNHMNHIFNSNTYQIFDYDLLTKTLNQFNLQKINLSDLSSFNDFNNYFKNILKYKNPEFLNLFIVDINFVTQFSKTIDKINDDNIKVNFLNHFLKIPDLLVIDNYLDILKSNIKNKNNLSLLNKILLNKELSNSINNNNVMKHANFKL